MGLARAVSSDIAFFQSDRVTVKDIAKRPRETTLFSRHLAASSLVLCVAFLSGCMGNGLGLADAAGVDGVKTGSIPAMAGNPALVDAAAVQTAVQMADVSDVSARPIPWANAQSGSAGVISSIEEDAVNGTVCRRFTTTRHSYQGIAKFDGNTCRTRNGDWTLTSFAPRS
jgi:surface antigen